MLHVRLLGHAPAALARLATGGLAAAGAAAIGALLIVAGFWAIYPPAGMIVAGLTMLVPALAAAYHRGSP